MSKLQDAENFLNKLRRLKKQNPDMIMDWTDVYSQLMDYGIPSSYSKNSETTKKHFQDWIKAFESSNNMKVFYDSNWPHFCQFISHDSKDLTRDMKFIKVYISLDKEHIYEGVKRIFGFLEKENIKHHSKVADEFRSDGIVIRLKYDDIESLKKLSDFVENDAYIQEGILKTNPFTPTIGSMAVIKDNGGSYNKRISISIDLFLEKINLKEPIEIKDFVKYATALFLKYDEEIWSEALLSAYDSKYTFKNLVDDNSLEYVIDDDKFNRFEQAIIVTYEKYGAQQALSAIKESLTGNFNLFPRYTKDNKNEVRRYIIDNLTADDIKNHIMKMENINGPIDDDIIISYFCCILYKYKGQIFDTALKATVAKFRNDQESVKIRIRKYRDQGKPEEFTSYGLDTEKKVNYRKSVVENIKPEEVMDVIKSILDVKGIEWLGMNQEELLEEYSRIVLKELALSTSRK